MDRIKYAKNLSEWIVKLSDGDISKDEADLAAFRYVSNKPKRHWWQPNHFSISQIANNYVIMKKQ